MIIEHDCGCEVVYRDGQEEVRLCAAHAAEAEQEYLVRWEIELTASSPWHAAVLAQQIQRDPEALPMVFDIFSPGHPPGVPVRIDLGESR